MDQEVARYLQAFGRGLRRLPEQERQDAIREIESHVEDGLAAGASADEVLRRLGHPQMLARAYLAAYHFSRVRPGGTQTMAEVASAVAFVGSAGLGGMIIVPVFAILSITFGLLAVMGPVAGVARVFGARWVTMDGPHGPLPLSWSIPVGFGLGLVSLAVTWGSYRALRFYVRLVAKGYERWLRPLALTSNLMSGK